MPSRPSPEVEAIVAGQHGDPFAFLGMHKRSAGLYVRAFLPDAEEVAVVDAASGEVAGRGERLHPAGLFVASLPEHKTPFRYRLRVLRGGNSACSACGSAFSGSSAPSGPTSSYL